MKIIGKLGLGLIILAILSPLGLFLPKYFKSGPAWGEWSKGSLWSAPLSDYAFKGWEEKGMGHLSLAYIVCAAAGIIIVFVVTLFLARAFLKNKTPDK